MDFDASEFFGLKLVSDTILLDSKTEQEWRRQVVWLYARSVVPLFVILVLVNQVVKFNTTLNVLFFFSVWALCFVLSVYETRKTTLDMRKWLLLKLAMDHILA